MSDICSCTHEHTAGRVGVCSSFLCPCNVWRAPSATRVTPLPWRAGIRGGCIVADDPTPDEHPLGRAEQSSIDYYGGIIVAESIRTADIDYAIRAVNEYEALVDFVDAWDAYLAAHEGSEEFDAIHAARARLDAVRSGT